MLDGQVLVTKQDLEQFQEKLDLLATRLDMVLMITKLPAVIKVAEISQIESVSVTQLRGKERYLLPRFGVSGFPDGTDRWTMEEYLEWKAIPPSKRKEMWKALPAKERQRIVMGKYAEAS